MMAKIYHDSDADLGVLKGKKIAVIGFGSQGKAQSMCLHDSGLNVTVGVRKGGKSWKDAKKNGMKVDEMGFVLDYGDRVGQSKMKVVRTIRSTLVLLLRRCWERITIYTPRHIAELEAAGTKVGPR